jgi:hypothetical protein
MNTNWKTNYRTRYGITAQQGRKFFTWAVVDNKDGTTVKRVIDLAQALDLAKTLNERWQERVDDWATDVDITA